MSGLILGIISLLFRGFAITFLVYMTINQFKIIQTKKDGLEQLRSLLFYLLLALSFQNILPIFLIIAQLFTSTPVNMELYWLNNSFFSLLASGLLLKIYTEK